jgi:hypothetical protein
MRSSLSFVDIKDFELEEFAIRQPSSLEFKF